MNSNFSILIRLPFGPDEVENIVEVSKVIRAIRLRLRIGCECQDLGPKEVSVYVVYDFNDKSIRNILCSEHEINE